MACRKKTTLALGPVLALAILVLALSASSCGRDDGGSASGAPGPRSASAGVRADSAGTRDSLAAETAAISDSAAADSTKAPQSRGKGGFLNALFKRHKEEPKKREAVPVELVEVTRGDVPYYLTGTATLEPEKQADILAKIQGEILEIRVEEGDWVAEGQLLAVLDGAAQEVAVEEAQARLHKLELDLERVRALHGDQLASDKDLHDAESNYEQAEAQRKAVQLQLSYTRILSPFAGQVTARTVDRGQTVSPGTRLFTVVDPQPLLARIHLPEREAARIHPGQQVWISPDTEVHREAPGEVTLVSPMVDARTGTVKITCQLSASLDGLRPGSFVRTRIATETHRDVLAVPKRALVPEGAETYVYRAVADSVLKVLVDVGATAEDLVEVTEGLEAGDRVVLVGQGALKTGSKIREIAREPEVAAAADSLHEAL